MFEIGFLGIGQGGSNICEIAENFNYTTAIINTSSEDLNAITNINPKNKFLLGTKGGAGKNRSLAISEVKNNLKSIVNFVNSIFSNSKIEIVYVVFTGGGGTGSGTGPIIVDILNRTIKNILFCPIIIIPAYSEGIGSLINATQAIDEIVKLNVPYTCFSNQKGFEKYKISSTSKKDLYNKINVNIISEFNSIFKNERKASKTGNMDSRDIHTLFTSPGYFFLHKTKLIIDDNDKSSIYANLTKEVISSWNQNLYLDLPYDLAVQYMGFIYNINNFKISDIDYNEIRKDVGTPIDTFEGIYEQSKESNDDNYEPYVISILTGLSSPKSSINEIVDIIKKNNDNRITDRDIDLGDLSWLKDLKKPVKETVKKDDELLEKLLNAPEGNFNEFNNDIEDSELIDDEGENLLDFLNNYE